MWYRGISITVHSKFGLFPSLSTVDVLAGDGLQRGPLSALQAVRLRPAHRHVTLGAVELDLGADVPRTGVVDSLGDSGTGAPARLALAHHGRGNPAKKAEVVCYVIPYTPFFIRSWA